MSYLNFAKNEIEKTVSKLSQIKNSTEQVVIDFLKFKKEISASLK